MALYDLHPKLLYELEVAFTGCGNTI